MKIIPYRYTVSEEIARWTFEVHIESALTQPDAWIAFTNPTAGPWKKISALTNAGVLEEIYRFNREEDRPDIVIVADRLKKIMIVEAKDAAAKLLHPAQMRKSVNVISNMARVLKIVPHQAWVQRRDYDIVPSFLWYAPTPASAKQDNLGVTNFFHATAQELGATITHPPVNITIIPESEQLTPHFWAAAKSAPSLLAALQR